MQQLCAHQNMHPAMAACEVYALLRKWRSPLRAHSDAELTEVWRLGEAVRRLLERNFHKLILEAGRRPLLLSYTGDCTPVQTRVVTAFRSDGRTCRRSGYQTQDYYVQISFGMYVDDVGVAEVAVLLSPPRPMRNGKSVREYHSLAVEFIVDPRDRGHEGILVRHFAFDRGQFSATQRVLRQHCTHKALRRPETSCASAPFLLYLLDWCVSTPCCLHDVHKSLHWSLHVAFTDAALLKNVFVSVDSCRKSCRQVCTLAPAWLWDALVLIQPSDLPPPEDLNDVWLACGVSVELIAELVDLRLWSVGGKVAVTSEAVGPALFERALYCLFSLWHLRKFTETRWASVGASCRSILAARLTGIQHLVQFILRTPHESAFHLGGFSRAGEAELEFVAVAALASWPTDAAMTCLLEDSRLVKR